jgi:hypothetical protein
MKTDLLLFIDDFELQNVIAYKHIYIFHPALQKTASLLLSIN